MCISVVFAGGGYLFSRFSSIGVNGENLGTDTDVNTLDEDTRETYTISFEWDNPNGLSNNEQASDVVATTGEIVPQLNESDTSSGNWYDKKPGQYPVNDANRHLFLGYFSETDGNGKLYYGVDSTINDVVDDIQYGRYNNSIIKPLRIFDKNFNVTLYAFYDEDTPNNSAPLYVLANPNGGEFEEQTKENNTFRIDTRIAPYKWPTDHVAPIAPEGYRFGGFYQNQDGSGTQYYDKDMNPLQPKIDRYGTLPMTIHAKWIPLGFTNITLDQNGGHGGSATVNVKNGESMPEENQYGPLVAPSRDGYRFLGYYDDRDLDINDPDIKKYYNADMTSASEWNKDDEEFILYARWEQINYTITLDHNNGTGDTDTVNNVHYDEAMPNKPQQAPNLDGYDFLGYYDDKDLDINDQNKNDPEIKSHQYYGSDMQSVKNWDKTVDNSTLYAMYIAKETTGGGDGGGDNNGNGGGDNNGNGGGDNGNGNGGDNNGNGGGDNGNGNGGNGDNNVTDDPVNNNNGSWKLYLIIGVSVGVLLIGGGVYFFLKKKGENGARKPVRRGGRRF